MGSILATIFALVCLIALLYLYAGLAGILLLIVLILILFPYIFIVLVRFADRNQGLGFRASVGGPKTFTKIYFKAQIKKNLQALIKIDRVSLEFKVPSNFSDIFSQ